MSGKQAERARARKAQRRKKQVAERKREVTRAGTLPAPSRMGFEDEDFEIGPDDYLPDGTVKASAALLYLAAPFVKQARAYTGRAFESVLMLVAVGWNIALLPEKRDELMSSLGGAMHDIPPEFHETIDALIDGVRQAKLELFPEDRRMFVSHNVDWSQGYPHVTVATVVAPEK